MTRRGGRLLGRAGGGRWLGLLLVLTPPASAGGAEGHRAGTEGPAPKLWRGSEGQVVMRGNEWNLCTTMDFVGVGRIEATEYRPIEMDGTSWPITVAQFRVERTVMSKSGPNTGDIFEFAALGGIDDTTGSETVVVDLHYPLVGEWWAVALEMHPNGFPYPAVHGAYRASSRLADVLPDEETLQRAWSRLCEIRRDGVYFSDLMTKGLPPEILTELGIEKLLRDRGLDWR